MLGLEGIGLVSSPSAQFPVDICSFTQIMREVVEPLRESWQRELATFELARVIRERAFDVGVEAHEVPLLRMVKKDSPL